ncbi:MAG: hypothetical protein GWN84_22375 [Gammaproteobacteria bacterium]|nr:hypothetical protein [Gammaproteobacteria bacterium]NIR85381.1 hypothetical protein [Gammaproteobacteria bacterium]NIR88899.1 hypothetical protein [Gammaproteobacteria bacterium]NIU06507.1 hypothetical protein [Gammaproteobacteria bacterium]NIV53400.1 hypothetical protein [Gammaproteobacteria bacterium]
MTKGFDDAGTTGVFAVEAGGPARLVHEYQMGDYGLEQVHELFQLGRLENCSEDDKTLLVLDAHEMRELKAMADAYSFDYEEEFIEMCHAMARFAAAHPAQRFVFMANF